VVKVAIQMPTDEKVICEECGSLQEAVWGPYGSEFPCIECDAAPVYLAKVGA
jgi:hypothetical protein